MSKNDTKSNKAPNFFTVTFNVLKAGLLPAVQPGYQHNFPNRKMLHEKASPAVQSVNEHLDKEGVDLHRAHIEHFQRGAEIDTHQPLLKDFGFIHNFMKNAKSIKNETKIVNSFYEEYKNEVRKGENADLKIKVYASSGMFAHTLLGAAKAAQNPYTAHEDDFAAGTTMDYYRNCK